MKQVSLQTHTILHGAVSSLFYSIFQPLYDFIYHKILEIYVSTESLCEHMSNAVKSYCILADVSSINPLPEQESKISSERLYSVRTG